MLAEAGFQSSRSQRRYVYNVRYLAKRTVASSDVWSGFSLNRPGAAKVDPDRPKRNAAEPQSV